MATNKKLKFFGHYFQAAAVTILRSAVTILRSAVTILRSAVTILRSSSTFTFSY
jgi:hypothetical protein